MTGRIEYVIMGILLAAGLVSFLADRSLARRMKAGGEAWSRLFKKRMVFAALTVVFGWVFLVFAVRMILEDPGAVGFSSARVTLWGIEFGGAVIIMCLVSVFLLLAAVLVRGLLIPKLKNKPGFIQSLLELASGTESEDRGRRPGSLKPNIRSYLSTLLFFLLFGAVSGLIGTGGGLTIDLTWIVSMILTSLLLIVFFAVGDAVGRRRDRISELRGLIADQTDKEDRAGKHRHTHEAGRDTASALTSVKEPKEKNLTKKKKRRRRLIIIGLTLLGWFAATMLIRLIFGELPERELEVSLGAERVRLFGLNLSVTIIGTWAVIVVLALLSLLVRFFVIPRMKDEPSGLQGILELAVDGISEYTQKQSGHLGDNLSAYIFTLVIFMVSSAGVELFGIRGPTADIMMTFAMAIITFALINYYGIRQKGILGRMKSFLEPTPVILPMKIISDIAIPISLACRLFGNMLGGMIVIDLLYHALGSGALLFPSILGLFFNVAHPLIQTFIFVTLSLTFINEAAE
jgi:F-type H+-transporting ATPase subunit a